MDGQSQALIAALAPFYPLLASVQPGSTSSVDFSKIEASIVKIQEGQGQILERLQALERTSQENLGGADAVEQVARNVEAATQAMSGRMQQIERRVEGCEGVVVERIKKVEKKVTDDNAALKKKVADDSAALKKKVADDSAALKREVVGALGDLKKAIGTENQAMKKTIEEQLKKVEKVVGGLDGRLGGVRDDIISKVAAVKAEVDVCGKLVRGACPKCFVIKPIKCRDQRGGGKRYCGNCEKEACEF
ncbi:hypothetical protein TrRE_jg13092 [Triparma retinervis]|uniref:Uncharacterized protein n=1 Tax=Triparma retinervis TaxID=2557542 RepID=A0A9W7AF65_9STRA|nr:hypothetical protein TrRE_jg13092 [Triparma retinervis]